MGQKPASPLMENKMGVMPVGKLLMNMAVPMRQIFCTQSASFRLIRQKEKNGLMLFAHCRIRKQVFSENLLIILFTQQRTVRLL